MRRKKYHLDRIKKVTERRARAAELIVNITARLQRGWNVWAEEAGNSRHYTPVADVCDYYRRYIDKMMATGAMKRASWLSYCSYLNVWREWVERICVEEVVYAYQLRTELLSDFLDFLLLDRDVSARTRNNYRMWLAAFGGWMVEKGFLAENPVTRIRTMPVEPKRREQLPPAELARLRDYLERRDRHFLLACMMEYYTFIRPEELTYIRVGDISVKEQRVRLSGEHTKNGRDAAVGLNGTLLRLMAELGVLSHAAGEYLFGGRDFRPGPRRVDGRVFREAFAKARRALGWPETYQFYSLKDSGIRDLANAEGIVVARDQARHTDVATTNRYLKGDALRVHEGTKHFRGGL